MGKSFSKHERSSPSLAAVVLCALFLAPCSSFAKANAGDPADCAGGDFFSNFFKPITEGLEKTGTMTCQHPKYKPKEQAACSNSCKAAVEKWKKEVPELAKAASDADKKVACTGAGVSATSAGGTRDTLTAFRGQQASTAAGATANKQREENARSANTKFEECKKDINSKCDKVPLNKGDTKIVSALLKACEDAAAGTGKFADQKKKDGAGMGDLSKLMDAASKAMGMIPQQPQESPSDIAGATSPTPASPAVASTTAPQIESIKFGSTIAPNSIGFGSLPAQKVALAGVGDSGSGLTGASVSSGEYGSTGGSGTPPGGSGGGDVGASGGGSGGGGGGGGSSGSSRARDEVLASASEAASGYEINGGGGARGFSGSLKPSKADMEAVADGSLLGPMDDSLGREPASEEPAAAIEETMEDDDTIFMRVRNKYGSLKGAGRI